MNQGKKTAPGTNSPLLNWQMLLPVTMSMRPTSAKIIQHAEGMGIPDTDAVRQRAEEVALINGRRAYTETDWQQAKRELHGGHNQSDGGHVMTDEVSERDMIASNPGHHVENMQLDDQESIAEELLAEGMDEALHEQMLASRHADSEDYDE